MALAKISAFCNTGFNLNAMPQNADLLVGDGPPRYQSSSSYAHDQDAIVAV